MKRLHYLSFLFTSLMLGATVQKYDIRHFNPENGLNGTYVYTTIQGLDGYKWIGTDYGLTRFDGLDFELIDANDSIKTNFVTAAYSSKNGKNYFGYFNGKIKTFNGVNLITLLDNSELKSPIKGILESNEMILGLSQNDGFITLTGDSALVYKPKALDYQKVNFMSRYGDIIFVGTNENLLLFQVDVNGKLAFIRKINDLSYISSLSMTRNKNRSDSYWIGTDYGLYHLNIGAEENGSQDEVYKADFLVDKSIVSIGEASNEDLWIGTKFNGLIKVNFNYDNSKSRQFTYLNQSNGFPGNQTSTMYMDSDASVWVGTIGDGLIQVTKKGLLFYNFEEFRARSVNGISGTTAHDFYYASDVGIIKGYYLGESDSLNFKLLDDKNSAGKNVSAIFTDKNDRVYYGSEDIGLFVADADFSESRQIVFDYGGGKFKPRQIIKDAKGNLWVSLTQKGLFVINPEGKLIKKFNTSTGFYHNEIYHVHFDRQGNTWFASHGAGLAVMKPDSTINYLTKDGIFPARDVNDISEDEFGNVWIGTNGSGIFEYTGEEFIRFTTGEGLLNNYSSSLMSDKSNHIWTTHRTGLSRLDEFTEAISTIQRKDGLVVAEFVHNSIFRDQDHNIWIGNRNGVTFLSAPEEIFESRMINPLIKDLQVNYKSIDLYQFSSSKEIEGKIPEEIEFPYDHNNLTFEFIAINLKNPESNLYQYMLEGQEENWSTNKSANQATFTNLRPGNYTFLVRQSDNPNHWGDNITRLSFTIRPPWWNTWWAIILFAATGFALIYGVIKWRTDRLTKRLDEKQRLISITETQNKRLKEFSFITSHNTRSSASNIMGLITALESDPGNNEFIKMLRFSSDRLNVTIRHINELLNFENERENLDNVSCHLKALIEKLMQQNESLIEQKGAQMKLNVPDDIYVMGVPTYLEGALNNLIDNALQYGVESTKEITISAEENAKHVVIRIEDKGIGIDLSRFSDKVFSLGARFHSDRTQGDGLGMFISKNQIEGMGGEVAIESEPGKGTKIFIYLKKASDLTVTS